MSDSVRPHRRQPIRLRCPWDSQGKNTGVGCHFFLQCMKVKVKSLSCARLRPGSSIHGIFQARVLEWVAIAFSEFLASVLTPWVKSCGTHLLSINSVFICPWYILTSSFLKNSFAEYGIIDFRTLKMSSHCLLDFIAEDEKSSVNFIECPLYMFGHVFLATLKVIVLGFQNVYCYVCSCGSLWVYYLEFIELLGWVDEYFLSFQEFYAIDSSCILSASFFLCFRTLIFHMLSHKSEFLLIFLHSFLFSVPQATYS